METILIAANIVLALILILLVLLQTSEGGALGLGLSQDNFAEAASKLEQTRDFPHINGCMDEASASTDSETLLSAITEAEAVFQEVAKKLFASRRETASFLLNNRSEYKVVINHLKRQYKDILYSFA